MSEPDCTGGKAIGEYADIQIGCEPQKAR